MDQRPRGSQRRPDRWRVCRRTASVLPSPGLWRAPDPHPPVGARPRLRALGWSVEAVDAYTTLPAGAGDIDADIAENFRAGYYDGAVLTASSQARALPPLLGLPPPSTRVVTIGAPTEAIARRQGIAVATQASSPTPDAIIRALIDALDHPAQADAPEERDS